MKVATPSGLPLLGHLLDMWRDPLALLRRAHQECGDLALIRFGPIHVYAVIHPDGVRRVLQDNASNYVKGPLYGKAAPMLGRGLLLSEGALWRRQRRVTQPLFQRARIPGMIGALVEVAEDLAGRWSMAAVEGHPVDAAADLLGVSLGAITRLLFGEDGRLDATAIAAALPGVIRHVERSLTLPLPLLDRLPTAGNLRFRDAVRAIDVGVDRLIARHAADPHAGSLLGRMLAARDPETGQTMSALELRDEIKTLLLAGYDTTGHAMAWTWHLLAHDPGVQARLQGELEALLAGRTPTAADLPGLVYTEQVVNEALRLFPPIWAFARAAVGADVILRQTIPAGALVTLNPYMTHRLPEFWTDPERFDPDRFAPDRARERPRHAYFPFGGGSRQCIGQPFAVAEMVLVLATLAQRVSARPAPGVRVEPVASLSLRPADGIPLALTRRRR